MSIQGMADELASLRDELGSLAAEHASAAMSTSRDKIEGAAQHIGETLQELEQLFAREEENLENIISSRPLASVAAAFVAGVAIGLMLRRGK